jgi:hypothetical protein
MQLSLQSAQKHCDSSVRTRAYYRFTFAFL